MIVTVVTPPDPLVTLEEAKQHLRVDHSDDDAMINAYIAAASAHLDGPRGWLDRSIGTQELQAVSAGFCDGKIHLPYGPVQSVEALVYLDADNAEQTIDPADYAVANDRIWFSYGYSLPAVYPAFNAVQISYTAGFDETPPALKAAVLMHVGTLYENRESVGDSKVVLPHAYEALCAPYKRWHI